MKGQKSYIFIIKKIKLSIPIASNAGRGILGKCFVPGKCSILVQLARIWMTLNVIFALHSQALQNTP